MSETAPPPTPPSQPKRPVPTPPRPAPRKKKPNYLLPLLLFGLLLFGGVFIGGFALMVFMMGGGPQLVDVKSDSVLKVRVAGVIAEYEPPNPMAALFNQQFVYFHDIVNAVNKAKTDVRISGIYLEIGGSSLGWAQAEELREALKDFKSDGKWIIAHGEIWTEKEYYLASVSDEVYFEPEGYLFLDGFMSRSSFYNELLTKYGVNVHVEAFGEYKSFADQYRNNAMSEAHREATSEMLNGLEATFLEAVAEKVPEIEPVASAIAAGLYRTDTAQELGLIDELKYTDEIHQLLKEKTGRTTEGPFGGAPVVRVGQYHGPDPFASFSGPAVAVIYAKGGIQSGSQSKGFFGDSVIASGDFLRHLKRAREDKRVKAIVLRIDSPGGSSLASDVMWREIQRTSLDFGKPVIASMGSVAASGGYYMAMACDEIVAQPTTITGSIGVVTMRWDFDDLYKKMLVNVDVVKTGESADFFDPHRKLTEAEIAAFHDRTQMAYQSFVQKAADSREMPYENLEPHARGRVWLGKDALERKLVDHLGGLDTALSLAAERAGLDDYAVINYPLQDDPWAAFSNGPNAVESKLAALLPYEMRLLWDLQSQSPQPFQTLALTPYDVNIE
ncbi:signal peptide peptidase SppA [Acanthopleuribacter pedis]|uniref:Signal peptide peptidase SppA n=1 Tax=Acanthopleuribacter pedis TaxID=442870 RepID=A0A8J7Q7R6_9BACT|nr:signal peptide peptidase SppA [Acanthopleuribacter pedis]MBO1319936.1 signal peptide peptidase SppA [Acanthopleuribacter pedis]